MYDIEAIYEADSVSHAVELLRSHPGARVIAGGSDVLIQVREGRLAGTVLVSIHCLDELRGVCLAEDGALCIGALTSFSHVSADPLIRRHIAVLGEAADTVGGPQIRNIGTIGGNVCNGVTSADTASTLVAYEAVMEYTGPEGAHRVPIAKHYVAAGKTALASDEILTAIIIPQESYAGTAGHYIKYAMREALDIATIGCSANIRLSVDRTIIERLRLAYGVAGPVPTRAFSAEAAANGKVADADTVEKAAQAVLDDIKPRNSWRASAAFRSHLAVEMARRTITEAIARARLGAGTTTIAGGGL
ncbi:MAG: xanthine dehydrogenase FAD-binding subunit XdhB [Spirochaetaceae bacterium]|jgi:xanthine dehydrogenase FAD-binding subunit|nr:xanthine dehydrogenase FAD-binding subunit XdhB [Spirochaetaceae bacterium]